jgi:hypothetical protein
VEEIAEDVVASEVILEEVLVEEIAEDVVASEVDVETTDQKCTEQYVMSVVRVAKYLFAHLETSLYSAVTVLKTSEMVATTVVETVETEVLKRVIVNLSLEIDVQVKMREEMVVLI